MSWIRDNTCGVVIEVYERAVMRNMPVFYESYGTLYNSMTSTNILVKTGLLNPGKGQSFYQGVHLSKDKNPVYNTISPGILSDTPAQGDKWLSLLLLLRNPIKPTLSELSRLFCRLRAVT